MLNKSYLHGALTVGLAATVVYLGLTRRTLEERAATASQHQTSEAAPENAPSLASQDSAPGEADLTHVRQALLKRALSATSDATSLAAPPAQDALTLARATLDQRLVSGAPNPSESARLEGTLRPLLVAAILGEAVAELRCSATLCKVSLIAEDDSRAARAASALRERLPKAFAAVVAYPESTGQRSIYLSTRSADLELSPAPEAVAQHEPAK